MRRTPILRKLILLCALLSVAAPAAADDVLIDGSVVRGTVTSMSGGVLIFVTPYGELKIPWSAVTALNITDPIVITIGGRTAAVTRVSAETGGRVILDPGGPVELAQITAVARPQPAVTIVGGANAGFLQTSGNTEVSSLRLDGDLAVRQNANSYRATAAFNRADERGTETARNWNSAFNYDRFVTTRLFVNANAIFTNDHFRDIDLRTALGTGVGYQVLNTPRVNLAANAGLGWVNENFEDGVDNRYTAARESASLDVGVLPGRVTVFHTHDGYFGVTGEDNLFLRTTNGVRVALFGSLVTTLSHYLDYDRSPSPGRENTDTTLALTFGYRF